MPPPAPCDKPPRSGPPFLFSILYPDIRPEHHPPALRECGLLPRRPGRQPLRPTQLQLRTRFLLRSIRPRSPNLRLRCLTVPANLPIAQPTSLSLLRMRMTRYSHFGLCPEYASRKRLPSSRRLSSCWRPWFSRLSFLPRASASP